MFLSLRRLQYKIPRIQIFGVEGRHIRGDGGAELTRGGGGTMGGA